MGYSFKKQKMYYSYWCFSKNIRWIQSQTKKIWVDKGSKFYNRSMKSCLRNNVIEIYSTYNEGKSVIAERFIRTLENKIYEYVTSISKMFKLINYMI